MRACLPMVVLVVGMCSSAAARDLSSRPAKIDGALVTLEVDARGIAFRHYVEKMKGKLLAEEGAIDAVIIKIGYDVPQFAVSGTQIWEVRIRTVLFPSKLRAIAWIHPETAKVYFVAAPWKTQGLNSPAVAQNLSTAPSKINGAKVALESDAKSIAFKHYVKKMGLKVLATESVKDITIIKIGYDVPRFAASGSQLWEARVGNGLVDWELRAVIWVNAETEDVALVTGAWIVDKETASAANASTNQPREADVSGQAANRQQVVEEVLSWPHGLSRLSPRQKQLLEAVTRNPGVYLSSFQLAAEKNIVAGRYDRAGRALTVLSRTKSRGSIEALSMVFVSTEKIRNSARNSKQKRELRQLQYGILALLGENFNETVAENVIHQLSGEPDLGPLALYLQKACVGNEDVVKKLQALVTDAQSPSYQNALLKYTVEKIQKPQGRSPVGPASGGSGRSILLVGLTSVLAIVVAGVWLFLRRRITRTSRQP